VVLSSRFALIRKSVFIEIFGDKDAKHFWEARFLPRWLPLLLGVALGVLSAVLIVDEALYFLIPLSLAVPAVIIFTRYPFVAVLLWMLLFPYFLKTSSTEGRYIYWILHRAMIPVALGIALLSHWLGMRKRKMVQFGRAELAMFLFLMLTVINLFLFDNDTTQTLIRFFDRLFVPFCMYWLIRLVDPTGRDLRRFFGVAFVTLIAQCVIGLLSWFAPQVLPPQWIFEATGARTVGTFGNPATYTTTLIFLSLLLFQYAMNSESRWGRSLLVLVVGFAFFCVFFAFSRGSWLGGILVLLGLMFLYPKVTLRLSVFVLVLVVILSNSILADEVGWAFERLNDERTAEDRIIGNVASIRMIQEKPWLGWGYDTYDVYDTRFTERVAGIDAGGHRRTSHNTYLTIVAEQGVIALLLYMFPVAWWLMLSLRVWRRLPRDGFWSWKLLVMLWLVILDHFIVSNFMDMVRFNWFGTTVWWLTLGLITSIVYPYLRPGDIGPPKWAYRSGGYI
jgi:O-antigen ligase